MQMTSFPLHHCILSLHDIHTPRFSFFLNVLRQPSDTIAVSLSHHHGAHEQLDRSDSLQLHLALSGRLVQAQLVSQLVLRNGVGVVDLVTQDDEGNLGKLLHRQEGVELGLGLGESLVVLGVDEEDDTVDVGEVISPDTTGLLVTTQIKGVESNIANGKLLRSRVKSRLQDSNSVVLQHVKQRGLSGIVETQEEQLGVLVEQAQGGQHIVEPVNNPHVGRLVKEVSLFPIHSLEARRKGE